MGKENRKREREGERREEKRRGGDATVGKSRYVRVTSYARYTCVQREKERHVCVGACVCAVCRNQWKRVEEAAWQERTVGRRTRRRRATGGGRVAVGRSVGGWSGRVRRIARVVQCG